MRARGHVHSASSAGRKDPRQYCVGQAVLVVDCARRAPKPPSLVASCSHVLVPLNAAHSTDASKTTSVTKLYSR